MGGAPSGKTGTGTVEIKVTDINDNIPTLEKSEVIHFFSLSQTKQNQLLTLCNKKDTTTLVSVLV